MPPEPIVHSGALGFAALALAPPLARAVEVLGFAQMTPVQAHALPSLLAGRDVIAQARTGSGKTVAFGLALLSRVVAHHAQVQALVLCPTRELADQVSGELRRLARFIPNFRVVTLCGGVPVRTQTPSFQVVPHVVVGTPGRILDHLERRTFTLNSLSVLVLDEADRMLDMGFFDAIQTVVAQMPAVRQTLLFSATFPKEIRALSRTLQQDPVEVTVDNTDSGGDIEQMFYEVENSLKVDALATLFLHHRPESSLVFCHTRNDVRDVVEKLSQRGFSVLALHGEMEQRDRDEVLLRFSNKSCSVLVATDVAARGLDIKGLPAVFSFELPTDPDVHVHRIGRTGRAGAKGLAVTLVSAQERDRLVPIERASGVSVPWSQLPTPTDLKPPRPPMTTLIIDGGRPDKLRAGDVLGALTGDVGLKADAIGKIDVGARQTLVAVRSEFAAAAATGLRTGKIKGKVFRVGTYN